MKSQPIGFMLLRTAKWHGNAPRVLEYGRVYRLPPIPELTDRPVGMPDVVLCRGQSSDGKPLADAGLLDATEVIAAVEAEAERAQGVANKLRRLGSSASRDMQRTADVLREAASDIREHCLPES